MTDRDGEGTAAGGFDGALRAYLSDRLGPAGEFAVEGEGGGYSNETLFVRWGDRDLVVRRPPPDETADTAHDVLREYRILEALQDTAVPVAPTVLACDDESVLGTEFYVMERLEGEAVHAEEPERFRTAARRRRLAEEFVDALVAVHGVDFEAVGLGAGDFGYPEGYLERQVERFSESLTWAFETTAAEREVPALYEVAAWLTANVPEESTHALVHGDYKLDNVLFGPGDRPEIVGVFDWEMSALGDPLADVGYALQFWPDPGDGERVVEERFAPPFLAHEDYPSRREVVARYEEQSGTAFTDRRFYLALAAYKMAALGEMFYARYLRGDLADPMYRAMGEGVPAQAERALEIIEGAWTV